MMLSALRENRAGDLHATLAEMEWLASASSNSCELEERELLECVGKEALSNGNEQAQTACFELLEHMAARDHAGTGLSRYVQ